MKLYEAFGKRGFHTSIATSFGADFDAYEAWCCLAFAALAASTICWPSTEGCLALLWTPAAGYRDTRAEPIPSPRPGPRLSSIPRSYCRSVADRRGWRTPRV